MTERLIGETGSRKRKRFLLVPVLLVMCMSVMALMSAATTLGAGACTAPAAIALNTFEIDTDANLKVDNASCIDWLAGGSGTAMRAGVVVKSDAPTGSGDDSFTEGTKEDTAVPVISGGSIPPNKSDLKSFGVFTERGATATFLNLFWARVQDPSGTTNMDFEFNQSSTLSANGVTPVRTDDDVLITYDLSRGGSFATISIRFWDDAAQKWGAAETLSASQALGTINTAPIPAVASGGLGDLSPRTFGEASINLNAIFTPGTCGSFGSAYLKSRSSDSFGAAMKDFIAPVAVNISNCTTITTQASGPVTIGSSISDTATLSGATAAAGGTITFSLYGPSATAVCTGAPIFTDTKPVSGNGNYTSASTTPTAVGSYYWIASYSGDANNASASGACGDANETSVVNKKQPAISTAATAAIFLGGTINDVATLSLATSDATGTITFSLYGPSATAVCTTTAVFTDTKSVSGNGNYTSASFTPTAAGSYYWIASYGGDAKNEPVSGTCGDSGETSVVNAVNSSLTTAQFIYPNDSATVSAPAGGNVQGSVTFRLYTTLANCNTGGTDIGTGGLLYSQSVNLPGTATSSTVSTTNSSISVNTNTTVYWRVTFASTNSAQIGRQSVCSENTQVAFVNDSGGGTAP